MPRLKDTYKAEVVPALIQKFQYKNVMQVPKLEKIVINMGMGDIKDNPKLLDSALDELTTISGQKPVVTVARKSVANFKVREGMKVGAKVTIRGDRMYEFFDKLVSIVIPRVRDFRGLNPKSFDGRGNYAMGFREQLVFPEIQYDKVEKVRGMDICIVTTARTDEEAREFLALMGMPFEK
ncbi:MAG: 50S ribosomal protein L5 [Christensenellaceae bacterium]|nr:50S ribosomal protein L5 [Christensenellaceae bacterium]